MNVPLGLRFNISVLLVVGMKFDLRVPSSKQNEDGHGIGPIGDTWEVTFRFYD
jgi:hypothetical protein